MDALCKAIGDLSASTAANAAAFRTFAMNLHDAMNWHASLKVLRAMGER